MPSRKHQGPRPARRVRAQALVLRLRGLVVAAATRGFSPGRPVGAAKVRGPAGAGPTGPRDDVPPQPRERSLRHDFPKSQTDRTQQRLLSGSHAGVSVGSERGVASERTGSGPSCGRCMARDVPEGTAVRAAAKPMIAAAAIMTRTGFVWRSEAADSLAFEQSTRSCGRCA